MYLKLDIIDKHGIVNVLPISTYDIMRLEEHDPSDPNKVEFKILHFNKFSLKKCSFFFNKMSYRKKIW